MCRYRNIYFNQFSWQKTFNRKFAYCWIQTVDLWSRKWRLHHLLCNHCPTFYNRFVSEDGCGRLVSWVVSRWALNIGMLHRALVCEFMPWWWHTLYQTQAQHLHFFMIFFGFFDLILIFVCQICHVHCETENWKSTKFIL